VARTALCSVGAAPSNRCRDVARPAKVPAFPVVRGRTLILKPSGLDRQRLLQIIWSR